MTILGRRDDEELGYTVAKSNHCVDSIVVEAMTHDDTTNQIVEQHKQAHDRHDRALKHWPLYLMGYAATFVGLVIISVVTALTFSTAMTLLMLVLAAHGAYSAHLWQRRRKLSTQYQGLMRQNLLKPRAAKAMSPEAAAHIEQCYEYARNIEAINQGGRDGTYITQAACEDRPMGMGII
jgi:hypothetical protein